MKIKELRDKKIDDLEKLLGDKRDGVMKMRFGGAGSKQKNVKEIQNEKKTIARILTLIREKKAVK